MPTPTAAAENAIGISIRSVPATVLFPAESGFISEACRIAGAFILPESSYGSITVRACNTCEDAISLDGSPKVWANPPSSCLYSSKPSSRRRSDSISVLTGIKKPLYMEA